jgi:glycerol-3-phosphate acyltransferase PlsY
MSPELAVPVSAAFGFACGSIPFGYLAGLTRGIDIRKQGSGNIGFTNVLRIMGTAWAIPVLLLDIAKGVFPTAFAAELGLLPALAGIGAILGHVFTPWLGFKGGKGVATTIGVAALLCARSLLPGLGLYAIVLLTTGFVSLSSMLFAVSLVPLTLLFYGTDPSLLAFTAGVSILVLVRHRANLGRLLRRTEPRLGLWVKLFGRHR